jgi:hypothetical protein
MFLFWTWAQNKYQISQIITYFLFSFPKLTLKPRALTLKCEPFPRVYEFLMIVTVQNNSFPKLKNKGILR